MMILKRIIGWIIILSFVAFIVWQSWGIVSKQGLGTLVTLICSIVGAGALMKLATYLISSNGKKYKK